MSFGLKILYTLKIGQRYHRSWLRKIIPYSTKNQTIYVTPETIYVTPVSLELAALNALPTEPLHHSG